MANPIHDRDLIADMARRLIIVDAQNTVFKIAGRLSGAQRYGCGDVTELQAQLAEAKQRLALAKLAAA